MSFEAIFPFITTSVSILFFLSVFDQYFRKRKSHQLMWAIAMFLFFVTAGAEFLALLLENWDPQLYKIYYVLAALQVSFMGGGVFYLLANRNMINDQNMYIPLILVSMIWFFFSFIFSFRDSIFLVILVPTLLSLLFGLSYPLIKKRIRITGKQFSHFYILFTLYIFIFMVYQASISSLNLDLLATGGEVSGLAWQTNVNEPRAVVRLFSPLFTVTAIIGLVGGAFYSYIVWQWSIKKYSGKFSLKTGVFNLYIGFGALALAGGGLLSGFGFGMLYISEVISVSLMYFGFLESDKISMSKLVDTLTLKFLRSPTSTNEILTKL